MVTNTGRLQGRRAVITGASSGIGEATARVFVREGAQVALVARRRDVLDTLARDLGPDVAFAVPCDVTDPSAVARMADEAWSRMGAIDVLVHSAGISRPMPLVDLTPDVWRDVIDTNLSGCFYVCREVGLRMHAGDGGVIVNVSSESALLGEAAFVAYCASKGGVLALTKALAAEFVPTVRVNAILPGTVDTPMLRRDLAELDDPEGAMRDVERRIPLGRIATPDEVARAILFLAADATFATGAALSLDGGTTAFLAPFAG